MQAGRPAASPQQVSRARAIQARLDERRGELPLDIEQLARRSNINRRTLDKYFEGDSPSPSFFLIAALGEALGLSLDDLASLGLPDE